MALALIPNNGDVITFGNQYLDERLMPGFLASCAAFRREAGKPVYVREGYRSDDDQRVIFVSRYKRVAYKTGVWYEGSYWVKLSGKATAAVPGSAAANHRLGICVDLWSGIDSSFTSREHLIWVRVSAPYGWTNTGRGFGEPWHQQGDVRLAPAGNYTPLDTKDSDMASANDIANALLACRIPVGGGTVTVQEALAAAWTSKAALIDGGTSMPNDSKSIAQTAAEARAYALSGRQVLLEGGDDMPTEGKVGVAYALADAIEKLGSIESTVNQQIIRDPQATITEPANGLLMSKQADDIEANTAARETLKIVRDLRDSMPKPGPGVVKVAGK